MVDSTSNIDDLSIAIGDIQDLLQRDNRVIIGIDGSLGAGKTVLSKTISEILGIPVIHIDNFIQPNRSGYVGSINFRLLADCLNERPVIVEGVCLLSVLTRAGHRPDYMIYVDQKEGQPPIRSRSSRELYTEVKAYMDKFKAKEQSDMIYKPLSMLMTGPIQQSSESVDVALITSQTKLASILAFGGILSLLLGCFVIISGGQTNDKTLLKIGGVEISASGIGGVVMATSFAWAFFAYRSKPSYSRQRMTSEEYTQDGGLARRQEHLTQTMFKMKSHPDD